MNVTWKHKGGTLWLYSNAGGDHEASSYEKALVEKIEVLRGGLMDVRANLRNIDGTNLEAADDETIDLSNEIAIIDKALGEDGN